MKEKHKTYPTIWQKSGLKKQTQLELTDVLKSNSLGKTIGKYVLIYCDPGVDDALMLAQAFSQKGITIHGIIAGAGNVLMVCMLDLIPFCF